MPVQLNISNAAGNAGAKTDSVVPVFAVRLPLINAADTAGVSAANRN